MNVPQPLTGEYGRGHEFAARFTSLAWQTEESVHIERVREILNRARACRVLVAGDLMLDEYVWGEVTRISPEAPVPVVRVTGESWFPGGAANVARNLREFSGWTGVMGVVGCDDSGRRLTESLRSTGIDVTGLIADPEHSTIVKTRVIAKHQQVVRVDREAIPRNPQSSAESARSAISKLVPAVDGVVLSDYGKGFLSQALVDSLMSAAAGRSIVITVDPSPVNPVAWNGITAIKPNRSEALRAAGLHELADRAGSANMMAVGSRLLEIWGTELVLLTLGEEGMMLFERGHPVFHTESKAREIFDVSGAGDTAIAVFTIALCAGATPAESTELANIASGIVVGKLGTATVAPDELLAQYEGGR